MKYKHIFLDLDRTLWDFEKNSQETLEELFVNYNLDQLGIKDMNQFIRTYKQKNESLWELYRVGKIQKKELRSERFLITLSEYNIYDKNLARDIGLSYTKECPKKKALIPYATEILEYLANKYTLHIITNGFEEVQAIKIKCSSIKKYFSTIITSEKAGVKKPDPKIFHFAINSAKSKIENSIMIGDDLKSDILGAKSVGLDQIYFNPHENRHSEKLTFEITSLNQIKEIL